MLITYDDMQRFVSYNYAEFTVHKHQRYLSVKAQDYITYIPPVTHAVVFRVGGIPSVMISEISH